MNCLDPLLDRVSGRSNDAEASLHRISRGYFLAAWVALAISLLVWTGFAVAALGFYLAAIMLRREGL